MAATAKHFPGHGAVVPDSHVAIPVDRRPLADLDEDLYPYRRLIGNGLAAVMAAHVIFEQVDDLPAGFSSRWIQQELRGNLGFDGAIFTDDLSMAGCGDRRRHAAARRGGPGGRLRRAFPVQRSPRCAASHRFFAGNRGSSEPGSDGAPARQARSDPGCAARFGGVAGLRGRGQGLYGAARSEAEFLIRMT